MSSLLGRSGPLAGRRIEVEAEMTVGRENADLVIDDPEVSRSHAVIRSTTEGLEIEDLGSTNGTFVNGSRISGSSPLSEGDTLRLGQTELEVEALTVIADFDPNQTVVSDLPLPPERDHEPADREAAAAEEPKSHEPEPEAEPEGEAPEPEAESEAPEPEAESKAPEPDPDAEAPEHAYSTEPLSAEQVRAAAKPPPTPAGPAPERRSTSELKLPKRLREAKRGVVIAGAVALVVILALAINALTSDPVGDYRAEVDGICAPSYDNLEAVQLGGSQNLRGLRNNVGKASNITSGLLADIRKVERPEEAAGKRLDAFVGSVKSVNQNLNRLDRALQSRKTARIKKARRSLDQSVNRTRKAADAYGFETCSKFPKL